MVSAAVMVPVLSGCACVQLPDAGSEGALLYEARCSVCHATPSPARHSLQEWKQVLPLMDRRMSERGMPALDDEERRIILAYLAQHAR